MYSSSGTYEAFATPRKPEGVPEVWGSLYDLRDLLKATISLRDGKPLTEMELGFKKKMVVKKLLAAIHERKSSLCITIINQRKGGHRM